MTLTPAAVHTDAFIGNKKLNCGPGSKPCGNACIPKDHKCRASWNKPVKLAAAAATLTAAGVGATALFHKRAEMRQAARELAFPAINTAFAAGNIARGNIASAAANMYHAAEGARNVKENINTLARGYGSDIRGLVNRGREAVYKWKHHRPAAKRRDTYARGFKVDLDQLAL